MPKGWAVVGKAAGAGSAPAAPPQPAGTDWSVSITGFPHNDQTQQNFAEITAIIHLNVPSIKYFSIFIFQGSAPPTNASDWIDIGVNVTRIAAGDTPVIFQRPQAATTQDWQLKLVASTANYTAKASDAGSVKTLSIPTWTAPAQPTGFSVTASYSSDGGVYDGHLTISFTASTDSQAAFYRVYRVFADGSYNPLGGESYAFEFSFAPAPGSGAFTWFQREGWPVGSAPSYSKWKIQAQSRAGVENTAAAPTSNLFVPASSGIDATKLVNLSSILSPEMQFVSGLIGVRLNGAEITTDPLTHQLKINGVSAAKLNVGTTIAAGVIFAGTLAVGVVYAGQVNASQMNAGQFNGLSLFLSKNGITTTVDSIYDSFAVEYSGVRVIDNATGGYTIHTASSFFASSPSGARAQIGRVGSGGTEAGICVLNSASGRSISMAASQSRIVLSDGTNDFRVTASGLLQNLSAITSVAGQWTGNGVLCVPPYSPYGAQGIAGAGFNPYVNGQQFFGDSKSIQVQIFCPGGGFIQNNWYIAEFVLYNGGPAVQFLKVRGGAVVGAEDFRTI